MISAAENFKRESGFGEFHRARCSYDEGPRRASPPSTKNGLLHLDTSKRCGSLAQFILDDMALRPQDQLVNRALRRVGDTLCGRYRLVRLIGVGGMAAVYAGVHRNGHAVAIKILHDRLSSDADTERRFRQEALLANKVDHPGVVPVIDDDVSEDGVSFLVMPLLAGETVRSRAARLGSRLPLDEVTVIGHAVLKTLAAAHARKIVHRDIKPENLFVTNLGELRVLDFGIARFFEAGGSRTATRSGIAVGTPGFMAPEQALGRWREVDGRTDLWAIGATMFTLLSGQYVHQGETAEEILVATGSRPPRDLADVAPDSPLELRQVVMRALAFAKGDRWENASAMQNAIDEFSLRHFGDLPSVLCEQLRKDRSRYPICDASGVDAESILTEDPKGRATFAPWPDRSASGSLRGFRAARTRTLPATPLRRDRRWLAGGLLVAAVLGLLIMRRIAASRAGERSEVAPTSAAASSNPDAAAHYAAGLQAWEDAALESAYDEFDEATRRDPTLAAAHLRCVVGKFWLDDEARSHYEQAVRYRKQLDTSDARLLEAYEPMLREIPDIQDAIVRLQTVTLKSPTLFALDALQVLQVQAGRFSEAKATIERMSVASPASPVALAARGIEAAMSGDIDDARQALQRCVNEAPRATNCWYTLLRLEINNGDCVDAERLAHRALAIDSEAAGFQRMLAQAIQGRGGPMEAVSSALDESWAGVGPDSTSRISDEANVLILQGKWDDAVAALQRSSSLVSGNKYALAHVWAAYRRGLLFLELGRPKEAGVVADDYLLHKDAWMTGDYSDDWINLIRVQYAARTISREAFASKRDDWLRSEEGRSGAVFARALQWLKAYALAVQTPGDADEALAALGRFSPLPASPMRTPDQDDAIGYTYLLAGKATESVPYLTKAARSCSAIEWPLEQTWSHLHLGMALEAVGDPSGACAEYAVVTSRWRGAPSVSAEFTTARRHALRCP